MTKLAKKMNVLASRSDAGLGLPKNNSKRRRAQKTLNAKPKGRRNRFVQFLHTSQLPDLL